MVEGQTNSTDGPDFDFLKHVKHEGNQYNFLAQISNGNQYAVGLYEDPKTPHNMAIKFEKLLGESEINSPMQ